MGEPEEGVAVIVTSSKPTTLLFVFPDTMFACGVRVISLSVIGEGIVGVI